MIKYQCPNCNATLETEQAAPVMCATCNVEMTKVEEAAAPETTESAE